MKLSYRSVLGSQVRTREGQKLGRVYGLVINPDTGKVEGAWLSFGIIPWSDILSFRGGRLEVRDASVVSAPEDVVRISEILKRNIPVMGNRVRGQSGTDYGRVIDVEFDSIDGFLKRLLASKSFLFWNFSPRLFSQESIISIESDAIVVRDLEAKAIPISSTELAEG